MENAQRKLLGGMYKKTSGQIQDLAYKNCPPCLNIMHSYIYI